jgi:hypothetical protein
VVCSISTLYISVRVDHVFLGGGMGGGRVSYGGMFRIVSNMGFETKVCASFNCVFSLVNL